MDSARLARAVATGAVILAENRLEQIRLDEKATHWCRAVALQQRPPAPVPFREKRLAAASPAVLLSSPETCRAIGRLFRRDLAR